MSGRPGTETDVRLVDVIGASWLVGIGARSCAPDRNEAVRAAVEAVGGFVSQFGRAEAAAD